MPGLNMAGVDERQAFAKLEALKEIRHKTISLEKTRVALLCDVSQMEEEERCLNEYRYKLPGNCVKLQRIATKSNVSMLSFCIACYYNIVIEITFGARPTCLICGEAYSFHSKNLGPKGKKRRRKKP